MRIKNEEIFENIDKVVLKIATIIDDCRNLQHNVLIFKNYNVNPISNSIEKFYHANEG